MQEDVKKLYIAISKIINKVKNEKGNLTFFRIINAKTKASFYNITKIIKGLGLSFEEFGKLLDEELPKDFLE